MISLQAVALSLLLLVALHGVAGQNMDCALIVPPNPLTSKGLATPFYLTALNAANGPCNQVNSVQAAFVQGAIIDHSTGQISIYNPLVIDAGTTPLVKPITPSLPTNYTAALWFGFNGNSLTLMDTAGQPSSLEQGNCLDGGGNTYSIFGQYSYCNAPAFFTQAAIAVQLGLLPVPAPGFDKKGNVCPTVRHFGVVDQDQSDNVVTTYLTVTKNSVKSVVQNTAINRANFKSTMVVDINGSDNRLLDQFIYGAIGCTAWSAPDLADPGLTVAALPLNEIQASVWAFPPVARIPPNDPMVMNNGNYDINKLNSYRRSVLQFEVITVADADPTRYCANLYNVGAAYISAYKSLLLNGSSPDPAFPNLYNFLINRYMASVTNLNCVVLLGGKPSPLQAQFDQQTNTIQSESFTPASVATVSAVDTSSNSDLVTIVPSNMMTCTDTSGTTTSSSGFKFDAASFGVGLGAMLAVCVAVAGAVVILRKQKDFQTSKAKMAQTAI